MTTVTLKIIKYVSKQIGGKCYSHSERDTQIGGDNNTISVDQRILAASVAIPVILLTIGKITEFVLVELQKKRENDIKLKELNDEYIRTKEFKDAVAKKNKNNII